MEAANGELDSEKVGVLHLGTELIAEEEQQVGGSACVRVRCGEGWVSKVTAEGEATMEPVDEPVAQYTCVKKAQIRAGFAIDSDKAGVLAAGTAVQALERVLNEQGVMRVRFAEGWVSERTATGALCLQLDSEAAPAPTPAPAPAPPKKKASPPPVPRKKAASPPPAPAPAPSPPSSQAFTCVRKSQIRSGFEMDSPKAVRPPTPLYSVLTTTP